MKRQIRRFGVIQTAKVLGVLYAAGGLVLAPVLALSVLFAGDSSPFGAAYVLLLPVIYGLFGFVMTAVGAAIYNLVASWIGGVEIELDDAGTDLDS